MAVFRKITQIFLLGLIKQYRFWVSPWFGNCCRFYPSCSGYAEEAIIKYGALKGIFLTFKRLIKCHPMHPGGVDRVP